MRSFQESVAAIATETFSLPHHGFRLTILALLLLFLTGCASTRPAEDSATDRYYPEWLTGAPYAPTFKVLDTESSLGPYARHAKTITLKDLVKMHGHPCDGLATRRLRIFGNAWRRDQQERGLDHEQVETGKRIQANKRKEHAS